MTDAMTAPIEVVRLEVPRLEVLGDPAADSCDGDFCAIPEHHTQAVVNRRIDDDRI